MYLNGGWRLMLSNRSTYIKLIVALLLVVTPLLHSFKVLAMTNVNSSQPSLDAIIRPEKPIIEMNENGITEGNILIDLIPSGVAEKNSRNPIDVVFVFDKSGSMSDFVKDGTKLQYAKDAVEIATNIFKENGKKGRDRDRFALVPFDTDINIINSIDTLKNNPTLVSNMVDKLSAQGGTNYTQALQKAREILVEDSKNNNGNPQEERDKFIIFLTDGIPTNSQKEMWVNGHYREITYLGGIFDLLFGQRITLPGQYKNVYYDANPGRNYAYFEHSSKIFRYENRFDISINDSIRSQAREEAAKLAGEDITLYSIGFGNENDLDMSFLTELSSISNGKAVQANVDTISEYFRKISTNLSSEYPSFNEGFVRFVPPDNVIIEEGHSIKKIGNEVIMDLEDIPFDPNPPQLNDQRLRYTLPVKLLSEGIYSFSFDIVYNGGAVVVKKSAVIEVKKSKIPLSKIAFEPNTKTMFIGEKIRLDNLLIFSPYNATNKKIESLTPLNSKYVSLEKVDNEWWIVAEKSGTETITVNAEEKDEKNQAISASLLIFVKEIDDQPGEGGGQSDPDIPNEPGEGLDYRW